MSGDQTPEWLNPQEMAAWRSFVETSSDLIAAIEADLVPTGMSLGEYQVLVFLSEADDHSLRMCDLAGKLHLSPSGLTRRLDGLVGRGWVERRSSESDRRVMLAVLTDAGQNHLAAAAPIHVASVRARIIDHLTADEQATMAATFAKIQANLCSAAGELAGRTVA